MMSASKRETVAMWDDQGPQLVNAYGGIWSNINGISGTLNSTLSESTTPGSTLEFSFQGSQVFITGAIVSNNTNYPQATYSIDGASSGTQEPFYDSTGNVVYYFQSPQLSADTHTLFMNITHASTQSPFFLDAVWFVPLSGTSTIGGIQTVTVIPSNTAVSSGKGNSTNVGAIAGGVVGGVFGLLALALVAFFLLRRKRGQPYYFAKPTAADMLGSEAFVQPSSPPGSPPQQDMRQQSSHGEPSGYTPSSVYGGSDMYSRGGTSSSGAPLNQAMTVSSRSPPQSESGGMSSTSEGQISGKAALMAQMYAREEPATVQHADSGVRFSTGEGPSNVPAEVPPSYSAA